MLRRLAWIAFFALAGYGVYQYAGSDEAEIRKELGQRAIELERGARELTEQALEFYDSEGQEAMKRAEELKERALEMLADIESGPEAEMAREAADQALAAAEEAIREAREKLRE